jgi:hypothetical protein
MHKGVQSVVETVLEGRAAVPRELLLLAPALPLLGFLGGLFGGERGVNWVGRTIREREQG